MTDLQVKLTAPNGRTYIQPTGLFINNEWVPSSNGKKIASINPTQVPNLRQYNLQSLTMQQERNRDSLCPRCLIRRRRQSRRRSPLSPQLPIMARPAGLRSRQTSVQTRRHRRRAPSRPRHNRNMGQRQTVHRRSRRGFDRGH